MGFLDKAINSTKSAFKTADEKLGNFVDTEKLDSKIRDEERKIKYLTAEAGEKVVAALREGGEVTKDMFSEIYDKIKECEQTIADLNAQKDEIKMKACDSKIEKLDSKKEEVQAEKDELASKGDAPEE